MLSGKFAFRLNLKDQNLYKKYYWKKVIGLIIPMLVYMAIKNWHVMAYNKHLAVTPLFYLRHFVVALFNGFYYMEYWFLYLLIALLVAVPFTAHMIQNLKLQDKKAFLMVGLFFATISTFLPHLLNVDFAIKYEFIGYTLFFYLGSFVEEFFVFKKSRIKLYLCGLFSLTINLIFVNFGINHGYNSTSPFYVIFTIAMFIGLRQLAQNFEAKYSSKIIDSLISLLGKHSLGVYMIHMIFVYLINDLNFLSHNIFGWLGSSLMVLIISVFVCFVLDNTIIKLLQRLCTKIFNLEKTFID